MEKRSWSKIAENTLLFGSGVGSVASVIFQQLLYTAAPLTLFLLLNLMNRRRFEQDSEQTVSNNFVYMDQRLSADLNAMEQKLTTTLPTKADLNNLQKVFSQKYQDGTAILQRHVTKQLDLFEKQKLSGIHHDVEALKAQYGQVSQALNGISTYLHRLVTTTRVEGLENSIGRLATELAQLQTHVRALANQPEVDLQPLQEQINHLNRRFNSLPAPFDASALKQDVESLVKMVGDLVHRREVTQLAGELEQLRESQQTIQQSLEPARVGLPRLQEKLDELGRQVESQTDTIAQQVAKTTREDNLIFTLQGADLAAAETHGSGQRSILQTVLAEARDELVIVWPWLSQDNFDDVLLQQFRQFLDRKGSIEMGLGHLGNLSQNRLSKCIDPRWVHQSLEMRFLYWSLQQLTQLKREYPRQFKFKVLGTHENFLVCDRTSAIVGVHNLTTASPVFPTLEMGLRTQNPPVIQGLLRRFQNPTIELQDTNAYFNRAATRYELGDKQGALADYTQVLRIRPQDEVAYNNRGVIYYDLEDKTKAIADFDQSLQLNPYNVVVYCNRGLVSGELDDKLGAIEHYSRAIQLEPDCTTAYFHRGLMRTRLGNKQGAISDYSEVIRLDSQSAIAYFYRGLAHTKLGNKLGAVEDLQTAVHLFTGQGDQISAQKALSTLSKLQKPTATVTVLQAVQRQGA